GFSSHQRQAARSVNRSSFILVGKNILVAVRHCQDSALLDRQQSAFLHHGISARIRSHLDQLVLRGQLLLQRNRLRVGQRHRKDGYGQKNNPWNQVVEFL